MKLIVGLGNPGPRHAGQRHNIGFMAVDRIAEDHGFPPFRAKFQGLVSEGRLGTGRAVLLKPTTYMNESGRSVGEAVRFFKLEPADVVVLHDELDLAPGKARVKSGGGHAGHNGLRSLHAHIGPDYERVRLGIGHPGHKDRVAGHVLHDFARADEGWLDDLLRGVSDGAPALAEGDGGRFMNAVSLKVSPPRSGGGKGGGGPKGGRSERAAAASDDGASGRPTGTRARGGGPSREEATRGAPSDPGPDPGTDPGASAPGGPSAVPEGSGPAGDGRGARRPQAASDERGRDDEPDRRSALQRLADRFR